MRTYPLAAVTACLVLTHVRAQDAPQSIISRRPNDLCIVAQLNRDLNAKHLKVGDQVSANVIQDVVARGQILVPRGSKLTGHVMEVASLTKDDPRSRLAMIFERADVKRGQASVIHGVVQAIAPPLPDPVLEAIMGSSSSAYGGGQNGHPVNTPAGQSNTPTPIITSGRTMNGTGALEQRERALENAGREAPESGLPEGALSSASRGVFGLPGLFLAGSQAIPAIISVGHNVELKSGTQIVLRLVDGLGPAN